LGLAPYTKKKTKKKSALNTTFSKKYLQKQFKKSDKNYKKIFSARSDNTPSKYAAQLTPLFLLFSSSFLPPQTACAWFGVKFHASTGALIKAA